MTPALRTMVQVALVVLLAGCTSLLPSPSTAARDLVLTVQPDAPADGVLLTIAEATRRQGGAMWVGGLLLIEPDGTAWLCEALGESFPPTCSGDRLRVENLGAMAVPKLAVGGEVSWTEQPIEVLGTVHAP